MHKIGIAFLAIPLILALAFILTRTPKHDDEMERMQNAQIAALYACARNEAYAQGGWWEQPMFEQCIDDWWNANGKRLGVDY